MQFKCRWCQKVAGRIGLWQCVRSDTVKIIYIYIYMQFKCRWCQKVAGRMGLWQYVRPETGNI